MQKSKVPQDRFFQKPVLCAGNSVRATPLKLSKPCEQCRPPGDLKHQGRGFDNRCPGGCPVAKSRSRRQANRRYRDFLRDGRGGFQCKSVGISGCAPIRCVDESSSKAVHRQASGPQRAARPSEGSRSRTARASRLVPRPDALMNRQDRMRLCKLHRVVTRVSATFHPLNRASLSPLGRHSGLSFSPVLRLMQSPEGIATRMKASIAHYQEFPGQSLLLAG